MYVIGTFTYPVYIEKPNWLPAIQLKPYRDKIPSEEKITVNKKRPGLCYTQHMNSIHLYKLQLN